METPKNRVNPLSLINMDSESTSEGVLPRIDFSRVDLKNPGTRDDWNSVKTQVRESLVEYGCFEAVFDQLPSSLRQSLFAAIKDFFALPLHQKQSTNLFNTPFPGYVGYRPLAVFDNMSFERADSLEHVEAVTSSVWGGCNLNFSKTLQSFAKQLSELDQIVRRMVVEIFGLEKYLDEHLNSTDYLLKLYEAPPNEYTKLGIPVHTDSNTVTIMYQNEVVGIEVLAKDGEWVTVKTSPDSFIVIIGKCLHAWLNGKLLPPFHLVMVTKEETGYSASLFSIPKSNYLLKTPGELLDEEHPLLYKPFRHLEYLEFYHSLAGRRTETPLKTFCGV